MFPFFKKKDESSAKLPQPGEKAKTNDDPSKDEDVLNNLAGQPKKPEPPKDAPKKPINDSKDTKKPELDIHPEKSGEKEAKGVEDDKSSLSPSSSSSDEKPKENKIIEPSDFIENPEELSEDAFLDHNEELGEKMPEPTKDELPKPKKLSPHEDIMEDTSDDRAKKMSFLNEDEDLLPTFEEAEITKTKSSKKSNDKQPLTKTKSRDKARKLTTQALKKNIRLIAPPKKFKATSLNDLKTVKTSIAEISVLKKENKKISSYCKKLETEINKLKNSNKTHDKNHND